MIKSILISAQMGGAGNLVKNLVLLDDRVFWPSNLDRAELIANQYPGYLQSNKSNWTRFEMDLHSKINNPYLMEFRPNLTNLDHPACAFLNHSLFWDWPEDFEQTLEKFSFVFVMPRTVFGREWQVRAAWEKVLKPHAENHRYHDFCFGGSDRQKQVLAHIADHGYAAYEKLNVFNMREILAYQQEQLLNKIKDFPVSVIFLEDLLLSPARRISRLVCAHNELNLDDKKVDDALTKWRSVHWPVEATFDWCYASD